MGPPVLFNFACTCNRLGPSKSATGTASLKHGQCHQEPSDILTLPRYTLAAHKHAHTNSPQELPNHTTLELEASETVYSAWLDKISTSDRSCCCKPTYGLHMPHSRQTAAKNLKQQSWLLKGTVYTSVVGVRVQNQIGKTFDAPKLHDLTP